MRSLSLAPRSVQSLHKRHLASSICTGYTLVHTLITGIKPRGRTPNTYFSSHQGSSLKHFYSFLLAVPCLLAPPSLYAPVHLSTPSVSYFCLHTPANEILIISYSSPYWSVSRETWPHSKADELKVSNTYNLTSVLVCMCVYDGICVFNLKVLLVNLL